MNETDAVARVAFEALWEEHYPQVLAYARRRFEEEDARDVAAETFLVAWRRRKDLPASDTTPWLYGVARRVASDRRRSSQRAERLTQRISQEPLDPRPDELPYPQGLLVALSQMNEADRELLLLIGWEGLTPAEAAVALGCSPAALRVRLHRARRRLSRLLPGDEAELTVATIRLAGGAPS